VLVQRGHWSNRSESSLSPHTDDQPDKMLRVASMAGLVKLHCGNWARDEWPVWAACCCDQLRLKVWRISEIDLLSPPRWIIEWQLGQTGTRSNSGDTFREERASEIGSR
jgi:hypothetical protein